MWLRSIYSPGVSCTIRNLFSTWQRNTVHLTRTSRWELYTKADHISIKRQINAYIKWYSICTYILGYLNTYPQKRPRAIQSTLQIKGFVEPRQMNVVRVDSHLETECERKFRSRKRKYHIQGSVAQYETVMKRRRAFKIVALWQFCVGLGSAAGVLFSCRITPIYSLGPESMISSNSAEVNVCRMAGQAIHTI